jgi:hypothetical protein
VLIISSKIFQGFCLLHKILNFRHTRIVVPAFCMIAQREGSALKQRAIKVFGLMRD